jgi:hypothetical protein
VMALSVWGSFFLAYPLIGAGVENRTLPILRQKVRELHSNFRLN